MMPQEGQAYNKLFNGKYAETLRTPPYCYYDHSDATGLTKMANISWEEYYEIITNHSSAPIEVSFSMELLQLLDVSERDQTMKLMVRVIKEWNDCRLRWRSKMTSRANL